jgi:hypothetical protein
MVNNSTNINKAITNISPKESLNSDGQLVIALLILVELLTITV